MHSMCWTSRFNPSVEKARNASCTSIPKKIGSRTSSAALISNVSSLDMDYAEESNHPFDPIAHSGVHRSRVHHRTSNQITPTLQIISSGMYHSYNHQLTSAASSGRNVSAHYSVTKVEYNPRHLSDRFSTIQPAQSSESTTRSVDKASASPIAPFKPTMQPAHKVDKAIDASQLPSDSVETCVRPPKSARKECRRERRIGPLHR
jgi:hypothetical protein